MSLLDSAAKNQSNTPENKFRYTNEDGEVRIQAKLEKLSSQLAKKDEV